MSPGPSHVFCDVKVFSQEKMIQHGVMAKFLLCNLKVQQQQNNFFQVFLSSTLFDSDVAVASKSWKWIVKGLRMTQRNVCGKLSGIPQIVTSPSDQLLPYFSSSRLRGLHFLSKHSTWRNVVQSKCSRSQQEKKKKIYEVAFLLHMKNASDGFACNTLGCCWVRGLQRKLFLILEGWQCTLHVIMLHFVLG